MIETLLAAAFGALLGLLERWLTQKRHEAAIEEGGRLQSELKHADEGRKAQEEMNEIASKPLSGEDVRKRLREGGL